MNDNAFIATEFDSKTVRVTEFDGWINVGELSRPGNRWRVEIRSDKWHDWSLVELWAMAEGMMIHLDTFVLPLEGNRCPPKDAPKDAFAAFDKGLTHKLERPVIERLLAYRAPVEAPCPPTPLVKRLIRTVLAWAKE